MKLHDVKVNTEINIILQKIMCLKVNIFIQKNNIYWYKKFEFTKKKDF